MSDETQQTDGSPAAPRAVVSSHLRIAYGAFCECGWQTASYYATRADAERMVENHCRIDGCKAVIVA